MSRQVSLSRRHRGVIGVALLPAAAATCFAHSLGIETAAAASFFCAPAPIKLGSYRPDDSHDELEIHVRIPDLSPFWFDDQTGDYMSYADGVAGELESSRLSLPLTWPLSEGSDKLEMGVTATFTVGQCVSSPMGVVPPPAEARP